MTVREWAEGWMERCDKPNVRPSTFAAHRYVMQNHILPGLGNVELEQLTEADVGQFLDERKRFGSHRPESTDYPGLGDETMRYIHRLLQQCLERAVVEKRIDKNPARAFHYTNPKPVKANVLSAMEIEDYLDAAERLGYLPMFTLELTSGLREGDAYVKHGLKFIEIFFYERNLPMKMHNQTFLQGRLCFLIIRLQQRSLQTST